MMSRETRDPGFLIGLHKLAQQNGDGLVPELYALLSRDEGRAPEDNLILFPAPAGNAANRTRSAGEGNPTNGVILPLRRS